MARAWVTRTWPDGAMLQVGVEVDGQHPDLLDELVRRVVALDAEAPNTGIVSDEAEGE